MKKKLLPDGLFIEIIRNKIRNSNFYINLTNWNHSLIKREFPKLLEYVFIMIRKCVFCFFFVACFVRLYILCIKTRCFSFPISLYLSIQLSLCYAQLQIITDGFFVCSKISYYSLCCNALKKIFWWRQKSVVMNENIWCVLIVIISLLYNKIK